MDSYTVEQVKPIGVHLIIPSSGFVSRMWYPPPLYFVMFPGSTITVKNLYLRWVTITLLIALP